MKSYSGRNRRLLVWLGFVPLLLFQTGCNEQRLQQLTAEVDQLHAEGAMLRAQIKQLESQLEVMRRLNEERELDVRIPMVVKARPLASSVQELIVDVDKNGKYSVVDEPYSWEELEALLENESNQTVSIRVHIRADDHTQFKYVAQVIGLCTKLGMGHYLTIEDDDNASADLDVGSAAESDD